MLFALLLALFSLLALAGDAAGEPSGIYAKFANCPYEDPQAAKCIYSRTVDGEVVLGSKKVPIVNPVVLQGAYTTSDKGGFASFIAPTNGDTLSEAPQPVPGGLSGIVAPAKASPLVKAIIALLFENDLTRVSATLELAKPAEAIHLHEESLAGETGTALALPVKVHLESPFLGPSCYIGSAAAPITWNLSTGTTAPPKPNKPITGTVGALEFFEEGAALELKGATLVDNAWSAPRASGCGGPLSSLVNPIVNTAAGLPAPAGHSAAVLEGEAFIASALTVEQHGE